jgi:single-stranded DNA-binding protein
MCICFIPKIVDAQVIKTSVAEILSNPDQYDGKMVHVEGRIQSLKFNTSKKGNPYTTFMVVDSSNNSLNVFASGTLSINRGDSVTVTGRYQKVKRVPPKDTFYNEIETTEDGVKKKGKY